MTQATLALRLAGPIQSWGAASEFNRRDTGPLPTKSGIVGLLAAARGFRRTDPIDELVALRLGVRIDEPGSLLRDYHTVSDYRTTRSHPRPLLTATVDAKGAQKPGSGQGAKLTQVTQRFYLQDAVFVAAVTGPSALIEGLADAVQRPAFPLALGRRACVPSQPLVIRGPSGVCWADDTSDVLGMVDWQVSETLRRVIRRRRQPAVTVSLPIVVDDDGGDDVLTDVPISFDPLRRGYRTRRVRHDRVEVRSGYTDSDVAGSLGSRHDPFELLGW